MMDNSIRVAIRLRPLENDEEPNGDMNVSSNNIIIDGKIFSYDNVFCGDVNNGVIYDKIVADQLSKIFEGYNLTIFAYGQTGSGKTYTMGTNYGHNNSPEKENDLGIIPRSLACLFERIQSKDNSCIFEVKISFLEVYNEEVYDLLHKSKVPVQCAVREDSDGFKVINLSEIPVNSVGEALTVLMQGSKYRSTASTAMNLHSSRSHSVLSINIEQKNNENLDIKRSKFQLIDLAGSECAKKTKASGERFKEGVSINKGLLALGNVICALCEEKSHIPYRDSKLTRLLTDCFGGNSHTLMIACISSSLYNSKETLNTLRYAARARSIKNKPVINRILTSEEQIDKLKKQVQMLEAQLLKQSSFSESLSVSGNSFDSKTGNFELRKNLQNALECIASLTEKLAKAEENLDVLKEKWKLFFNNIVKCISLLEHNENMSDEWEELLKNLKLMKDSLESMVSSDSSLFIMPEHKSPEISESEVLEGTDFEMATNDDDAFTNDTAVEGGQLSLKLQNMNLEIERNKKFAEYFEIFGQVIDWNELSPDDMKIIKEKIQELLKEKSELEDALRMSEQKLLEENQKRYEKCNAKIKRLTKEVEKSEIVARFKAEYIKSQEKFKEQIQSLKYARTKLIKELKENKVQHGKFRREKEKEVAQLKQSERKKDFEIIKLKNRYEKQTNVLKQKLEYLKKMKQQNDTHRNNIWNIHNSDKKKSDINDWIIKEIELEVFSNVIAAQFDSAKKDANELVQINAEQMHFQTELASIQDMEAKLGFHRNELSQFKSFNSTKKGVERWNIITSLTEARTALTTLFDKCISSQLEASKKAEEFEHEMESEKIKYEKINNNLSSKIKVLNEEINRITQSYELKLEKEKMERENLAVNYLKNIHEFGKVFIDEKDSSVLLEKIQSQEEEIYKLSKCIQAYDAKCAEVEYWKQECLKKKRKKEKSYLTHMSPFVNSSTKQRTTSLMESFLEDSEDSFSVNEIDDPDWRKTPLNKRKRRSPLTESNGYVNNCEEQSDIPSKRSFSGCDCPSNCKSNRCACRKRKQECSSGCDCKKEECVNRIEMEIH